MGCANTPGTCVPTAWQGADASSYPADFPGQTRSLSEPACSRGACWETACPGLRSAL